MADGLPGSEASTRRWVAALCLLYALLHVPLLALPINRRHLWRQADTAAVARNLAFESFDLLRPRIDAREDGSGVTGMEFPAYQATAAVAMRATGSDADGWAKAVALLCGVGVIALGSRLLSEEYGVDRVSAALAFFASPILFAYSTKVMPETFGLLGIVAGSLAFARARRGGRWPWWVASAAAFAIGVAVRPYLVFACLPILIGFIRCLRRDRPGALRHALLGLAILAPFVVWHYWWCPRLVAASGLDYFYRGTPLAEALHQLSLPGTWVALGGKLGSHYVGWGFLPLALLGAWRLWREGRERLVFALGIPCVALATLLPMTGRHFDPHVYYLFVLIPSIALLTAAGIAWLSARGARWRSALAAAVVVVTVASHLHEYRPSKEHALFARARAEVAARTAAADLIAVEALGGSHAFALHPLRRRGWVIPGADLRRPEVVADLAARGAAWVVVRDGDYRLHRIDAWLAGLGAP